MDADILNINKSLQRDPSYMKAVYEEIDKKFLKIKEEIISEFDNHPVTKEIEAGISSSNISGTLNGITNLYSFIGFNEGEQPTKPIRDLLQKSDYRILFNSNSMSSSVIFEIPSSQDIFATTPMPWAVGRSWARGIEVGISGIGYYLKIQKESRSGLGIQSQNLVRPNIRFSNIPYISSLVNKFNSKLKNLNK